MRHLLSSAGLLVITAALTATVHAQNPPAKPIENPDPHKTATLTGCLEASASLPGFRLTNVAVAEASPKATSPPQPTATSGAPEKAPKVYELSAKENVNLSMYAGQRVALTGTFPEADEDQKPVPPLAATAPGPLPKFEVMSVKTIAATCS